MIPKLKIKKNDTVRVISGRDRGKQGRVTQVFPQQGMVVVEGINIRTRHLRGGKGKQAGSKVQFAAPLKVSKVMVLCQNCNRLARVRSLASADGNKVRSCHRCQQPLVLATS